MVEIELMLSLVREESRFCVISHILVLFGFFVCLIIKKNYSFRSELFFSLLLFSFHQALSYAKSAFYAQLKLCNTHHSTFILVAVITAAPALFSYFCMGLHVCVHTRYFGLC